MIQPNIRDLLLLDVPDVTADNIGEWNLLSPTPGDGVLRDAVPGEWRNPEMLGTARVAVLGPKSAIYCHKNANKMKMITALTSGITLWMQENNTMKKIDLPEGWSVGVREDTWHAVASVLGGKFMVEPSSDDPVIVWEAAKYRERP